MYIYIYILYVYIYINASPHSCVLKPWDLGCP